MKRPMTDERTAAHARRVLKEHQKRINPRAVQSDDEAFERIKRTGEVDSLARQLRESFGLDQRSQNGR